MKTLYVGEKRETTTEENWDKMNRMTCGLIRSCLIQDIKDHVLHETSIRQLWEILEKKYLTKNIDFAITVEEEALSLPDEERTLH